MDDLTYLRKLMGDAWIDAEVCGENPTHLLGQYYKNKDARVWLRHTEALVRELMTNPRVKFDAKVLADKIKAPFNSTLVEMESAAFLVRQGFEVVVEPNAPQKGPDLRADWDNVPYFVEVRAVGLSEDDDSHKRVTKQIFARLNQTPSSYSAEIEIGDQYTADSPRTNCAVAAVVEALGVMKEHTFKKATFYYAHPNRKLLIPHDGPRPLNTEAAKIVEAADFTVRFDDTGREMERTLVSIKKPLKFPLQPVNHHERLKDIIYKKRKQLPKSSRGIITLDVSEQQFMLTDFSVEAALYGDFVVQIKSVPPEDPVGDFTLTTNHRGLFAKTSRVSAVVIQRRCVEQDRAICERKVYPTDRANADTIRLTLAELQRFGDIEDRQSLAAEHALNHVDEDVETHNLIDDEQT